MRLVLVSSTLFVASLLGTTSADDKDAEKVKAMRNVVLKDLFASEDKSAEVAGAYKRLFTHVGLAGLKKVAEDEDTSIALQAAWELHRKSVKRDPPVLDRTDWVFDKKSMEEFLKFVAKRLKAKPPAWWGATLLKGDVFPGQHHAFIDNEGPLPPAATVKVEKDHVAITSGKQSVKIPKADFDKAAGDLDIGTSPVIMCGAELSFIARPVFRGYPFEVIGVDFKTGKKSWGATVWAARRGFSSGPAGVNPVEIRRQGDTVIVYGCESHGMYAEGFDAKTGKCQFRFCTCYWFNNSEAWGLK
jgi:hypothetical protein